MVGGLDESYRATAPSRCSVVFWLTVLRIRKRKFSTWVFGTEIITVLSFATNIYIHAAHWKA